MINRPMPADDAPAKVRAYRSGFMGSMLALHKACVTNIPAAPRQNARRRCACDVPASAPSKCFSWSSLSVELPRTATEGRKRQRMAVAAATRSNREKKKAAAAAAIAAIRRRPNTSSEVCPSTTTPVMLLDFDATLKPAERNQRWSPDRRDRERLDPMLDLALKNKHSGAQLFNKTSGGFVPPRYSTSSSYSRMAMRKARNSLALGRAVSRAGLLSPAVNGSLSRTALPLLDPQPHVLMDGLNTSNGASKFSSSLLSAESSMSESMLISSFKRTMTASAAALGRSKEARRMHEIQPGCLGMTCSRVEPAPDIGPIFVMNGLPYRKRLTRSRLGFRSWRGRDGENVQQANWLASYFEEADREEKRNLYEKRKRKARAFGKRTLPVHARHSNSGASDDGGHQRRGGEQRIISAC